MLTRDGYHVIAADSGEAALQTVRRNPNIDLILMDIDLGDGIDGTEAAERILAVRAVPIVFLTSHQEREIVERTQDLTNYGYVVKDSGEFVLLESIRMALELFRAHTAARRSATQLRALFDATADPIFVVNASLRVVLANTSAVRLAEPGSPPPEGRNFAEIYPEYADEMRLVVHACLQEQAPLEFTAPLELRAAGARTYSCRCAPVEMVGYSEPCVQFSLTEVAEEIETEGNAPLDSLLPAITRNAPGFLFRLIRPPAGRFAFNYVSEGIFRYFGYRAKDVIENPAALIRAVPVGDRLKIRRALRESARSDGPLSETLGLTSADGKKMWVRVQASTEHREDGTIAWTGICIDATDEARATERLRRLLMEQEHLTREMNHRIKNNLAMVTSLLSLKQDSSDPPVDLSDVTNRIEAIRLLHDLMHRTESAQQIDMERYLESIVNTAFSALGESEVSLRLDLSPLFVPADQALPVALIVNEIATNAVKHGFPVADQKWFSLSFSALENGYLLATESCGPALPAAMSTHQQHGMGMRLVEALADQLSGNLTVDSGPPPRFELSIPESV